MGNKIKVLLAVSLIPEFFLVQWLGSHPLWIENYYSRGFYSLQSVVLRRLFGWIPFSAGDLFYTIAALLLLRFLWLKGRLFFYSTRLFFIEVLAAAAIIYAAFYLFWGLNYYRLPISKTLNIQQTHEVAELHEFTWDLIEKTNLHHKIVQPDTLKPIDIPYSVHQIFELSQKGYKKLAQEHPVFDYKGKSIKTSIYSLFLTYMGYSGYLNPFTNEAQVNYLMYDFKVPVVSCHEIAHQLGYSAENEANFIGYLAALETKDPYFEFSAYAYVLRYCLGVIKSDDPALFEEMSGCINPGILENYREVARFWEQYKNPSEPVFKLAYGRFLKINNQPRGIKSYAEVVDLLINYHRENGL